MTHVFQDFEKKLGMFLAQNIQYLADIKLNISVEDPNFTENLIQGSFSIQVDFIQLRTVYSTGYILHTGGFYTAQNLLQGSFSIQVDLIQLRTYSRVHAPYRQILWKQNLLQGSFSIQVDFIQIEPNPGFILHTDRSYTDRTYSRVHSPYRQILYKQNLLQGSCSIPLDLIQIEPTPRFMLHTVGSYMDRTYSRVYSLYRQILDLIRIELTPGFIPN